MDDNLDNADIERAEHRFLVWLYIQMTSHGSELKHRNQEAYNDIMHNLTELKGNAKFRGTCDFLDSECNLKPRQGAF